MKKYKIGDKIVFRFSQGIGAGFIKEIDAQRKEYLVEGSKNDLENSFIYGWVKFSSVLLED